MGLFDNGRRRGSLSLSVESIVILIIAITMLGLALGFIRNMFSKVSNNFDDMVRLEQSPPAPSSATAITLSSEGKTVKAGDSAVVKVDIFNPTDGKLTIVTPILACPGLIPEGDPAPPAKITVTDPNPKDISNSEFQEYTELFKIDRATAADTYLCSISAVTHEDAADAKKIPYIADFTITVTR